MDLQEFITETLVQLVSGIEDAAARLKDSTCQVSPRNISPSPLGNTKVYGYLGVPDDDARIVETVTFDVAVTTAEGKSKEGKLRVGIASLGIGGEAKGESSNATESRIQFTVPIVLPNPSNEQQ